MRTRRLAVLVVVALGAGLLGFVPSSAASPAAVRLHLAPDARQFSFGSTVQPVAAGPSSCAITGTEPLIDLSSGWKTAPGVSGDSIGVRSSGSNGTPCGQIDSTESLTLRPGTTLAGRTFIGLRLDLEMTGNAVVVLTLSRGHTSATYKLQTGRSITASQSGEADYDRTVPYVVSSGPGDTVDACAAPNSSGPNSSANDNCQWNVNPGFAFDTIRIATTCGTVALEGSGDFGGDPAFDSLFFLSNSPPNAANDLFTTAEDTPLTGNVLANDADPDGNALSAALATGPTNGAVVLQPTGAFTYTPAADYFGSDSFTYDASDGITTARATVSITVTAVNDPPVATSTSVSTDEDAEVTVRIATDVDSSVIDVACTGAGNDGVVNNRDGTVTYTPPADFNGSGDLVCTATDGEGATSSSNATITVVVTPTNDAPVANDDTAEVNEGESVVIAVLANDTDVDGDTLTPVDVADVAPAGASATANPDGTVTYTAPLGYEGAGSFSYRASDGTATSNVASVAVTVFPTISTDETVTVTDGETFGAFTLLTETAVNKRYVIEANADTAEVLFRPLGTERAEFRGRVSFGPEPAPAAGGSGTFALRLRYDPTGGFDFRPMQWCIGPVFDANSNVTTATLPTGESWCIASADTRPDASGDLVVTWQIYGRDDPRLTR